MSNKYFYFWHFEYILMPIYLCPFIRRITEQCVQRGVSTLSKRSECFSPRLCLPRSHEANRHIRVCETLGSVKPVALFKAAFRRRLLFSQIQFSHNKRRPQLCRRSPPFLITDVWHAHGDVSMLAHHFSVLTHPAGDSPARPCPPSLGISISMLTGPPGGERS